jgi:hypothetical protein
MAHADVELSEAADMVPKVPLSLCPHHVPFVCIIVTLCTSELVQLQ